MRRRVVQDRLRQGGEDAIAAGDHALMADDLDEARQSLGDRIGQTARQWHAGARHVARRVAIEDDGGRPAFSGSGRLSSGLRGIGADGGATAARMAASRPIFW